MYARHVTMQLKNNVIREFPTVLEKEILPLLRKQRGFMDEMLFITPDKNDAVAISLWEEKEHADAYSRDTYPQVVRILDKYIESSPVVKPFEVKYSTFHKMAHA